MTSNSAHRRFLLVVTASLAATLATVNAHARNTNTTTQEGRVCINRTLQSGDTNDNSTYQDCKVNINRTVQRGGENRNRTGQFGRVNHNRARQSQGGRRTAQEQVRATLGKVRLDRSGPAREDGGQAGSHGKRFRYAVSRRGRDR